MKTRHEEYFNEMFKEYYEYPEIFRFKFFRPEIGPSGRYVRYIKSELKALENEYNLSFRADASFYLLNNIMTMVVYPFLLDGRQDDILDDLKHDLRVLMDNISKSNTANKNISGHDIIIASYKMWDKLKTMGNDSW